MLFRKSVSRYIMRVVREGGLARTRRLATWPLRRTDSSAGPEGGQCLLAKKSIRRGRREMKREISRKW